MTLETARWQKILAQGFASANELLAYLNLPLPLDAFEPTFPLRVPKRFAARMRLGDPNDPLLKQVLAQSIEQKSIEGYLSDPLQEKKVNPVEGLIHKYGGRVLLTLTGHCAVNCRYCFRQNFPYSENIPGRKRWQNAIDYIKNNPLIHEVILSGGDPLLATDVLIDHILCALEAIPHLKTIRIHTRLPIVLPERFTPALLARLSQTRLRKVLIIHSNHAQEFDDSVRQVCHDLRRAGYHLLNQSVLLKGVNDNVDTLVNLSETCFDYGILPYYLHLLDKVSGTAHFDIPETQAYALYAELQTRLPGYLVPRLVREEAGKAHKTLMHGMIQNKSI